MANTQLDSRIDEALRMPGGDETLKRLIAIIDDHAVATERAASLGQDEVKAVTGSILSRLDREKTRAMAEGAINRCGLLDHWRQRLKTRMVFHLIGLASTEEEIAALALSNRKTILTDLIPLWVKAQRENLANGNRAGFDGTARRCGYVLDSLGEKARLVWSAEDAWCDGKKALLAGECSEGLRLFKKGEAFLDKPDLYEFLWRMQDRIARLLLATGRQAHAFTVYRQALVSAEFIRMKTEISLRSDMAKLLQPLFYGALEAAFAQSLFKECLILVEMAKARGLLDLRGMKELRSMEALPIQTPTGTPCKERQPPVKATILPQFMADFLHGKTDLRRFFSLLPEKSVAIHYFLADPYLYILVVTPSGGLDVKQLLLAKGFYRACRDVLSSCDTPGRARRDLLGYLYDVLVEPVECFFPEETEILSIMPHSTLHFLPFQAFLRPDGKGGREFLVTHFDLVYSPGMSLLDLLADQGVPHSKKEAGISALVMGNPDLGDPAKDLPGAEAEAHLVAAILGSKALTRDEATTEAFMAKAGEADVISLSCHGHPRVDRPLEGYLALHGPPLSVERILGLDLKAGLVSLSTCYSGVERVIPGDESAGITQAFFAAGARSVISSLWEVPDRAARELMGRFFLHWIRGKLTKAKALRLAQIEMIYAEGGDGQRQGFDPADPYYWAFPKLIGEQG